MKKILLFLLAIVVILIIAFITFVFMMKYEPTPNKSIVEKIVGINDLKEFGDVESSYLYTPKNYAYFNEENVVVVEKFFNKEEQYRNQYIVIQRAVKITEDDQEVVKKLHEASYKVTFSANGYDYLQFVSPSNENFINFSARGYKRLLDF